MQAPAVQPAAEPRASSTTELQPALHCTSGSQKQPHHLRTEREKSSRPVSGRKEVKRSKGSLSFRKASFPLPGNGLKTPELSACLEARSIWCIGTRDCRVYSSFGSYSWGLPSLSFHWHPVWSNKNAPLFPPADLQTTAQHIREK